MQEPTLEIQEGRVALMTAMSLTQGLTQYAEGLNTLAQIIEGGASDPRLLQLGAVTTSLMWPITQQLGMILQEIETAWALLPGPRNDQRGDLRPRKRRQAG